MRWIKTKTRLPHSHKVVNHVIVRYKTAEVSTQKWLPSEDYKEWWIENIEEWLDETAAASPVSGFAPLMERIKELEGKITGLEASNDYLDQCRRDWANQCVSQAKTIEIYENMYGPQV